METGAYRDKRPLNLRAGMELLTVEWIPGMDIEQAASGLPSENQSTRNRAVLPMILAIAGRFCLVRLTVV